MTILQKYALVTGGNRGIGLEVVRQLVAKGKPVLLACRDQAAGNTVAQDLAKANNGNVKCIALDTASHDSIQQLAARVRKDYDQQIDLVVNNAGVSIGSNWDKQTYDKTIAVNVAGPIAISTALLPHLSPGAVIVMVSSGLGALSNVSSDYAQAIQALNKYEDLPAVPFNPDSGMGTSPPGQGSWSPAYSVSKALLNRAVQLMSQDGAFKQRNVSVVSVCPGWCRTDMGSQAADRSAEQGGYSVLWPYFNQNSGINGTFMRDGEQKNW